MGSPFLMVRSSQGGAPLFQPASRLSTPQRARGSATLSPVGCRLRFGALIGFWRAGANSGVSRQHCNAGLLVMDEFWLHASASATLSPVGCRLRFGALIGFWRAGANSGVSRQHCNAGLLVMDEFWLHASASATLSPVGSRLQKQKSLPPLFRGREAFNSVSAGFTPDLACRRGCPRGTLSSVQTSAFRRTRSAVRLPRSGLGP